MTTQILDTRTSDTRASFIPIARLSVHEANVRRTDRRADIEALAASIEAHGLLQNLTVVARPDGRFAVVAGGRRLAALKLLARQGRIPKDFAAPCQIVPDGAAGETSLAENVQRLAMNVMDEVEAFERLSAEGQSADDIARRFGATVRHVEQRLALARLSPKIKAAYRRAELTLDVARAFCLAADHAAQEAAFRSMGKPIVHAAGVRAALTQGRIPAHDRIARYVEIEAYEAAGGRVSRDLFDETTVFFDDSDLLRRLAADKTDALRESLVAHGWGWAELSQGYGAVDGCANERLRPSRRDLTAEEAAERSALAARLDELDSVLADADDGDARWTERDALDAQLNAFDQETLSFDPALMKHAGVAVAIGPDGRPELTHGLIRRADLKAYAKARQAASDASEGASDPVSDDNDHGAPRLPRNVTLALTQARTLALRSALARDPHVALAAAVDLLTRASRYDRQAAFDIGATPKHFEGEAPVDDAPLAFLELTALSTDALLERLARLVATTLDVTHAGVGPHDDRLQHAGDALAAALDLDMTRVWSADEAFWRQIPKALTLAAIAEAPSLMDLGAAERTAMLTHLGRMKKADLASAAAQTLDGVGWLPDVLVTPTLAGALTLTADGKAAVAEPHAA